ncbi:Orf y [Tanacetum coccineum]
MGFQYSVDNVVDHLTTTGITAIPGERRSVEELEGMSWNLRPSEQTLQKLEIKWENPFTAKRGENYSVLHLSRNEEKDDDMSYPKFNIFKQLAAQIINKHEEHVYPTATDVESSTSYQTPPDAIIGPAVYPPVRQKPQPTYKLDYQFGYPQGRGNTFNRGYDEYHNSQWTLPLAWTKSGVKLVLPADPGLWSNLAVKSGKLYFPSTTEKLFAKLPPSVSKKIEESFKAKHPSLSTGVLPAIKFTDTFISKMCKDAALAKELRELSLCSAIPISGYYKNNRKKYGIRKTLRKRLQNISEGEGDVHQNINIMVQDTPFEEATFRAIEGINESDDEQSIEEDYYSHHAFMFHPGPLIKIADMLKIEQIRLEEQKEEEIRKLKTQLQKEKEKETEAQYSSEEFSPLGNPQIARPFVEAEVHYSRNTTTTPKIRKTTNQLYNVKVEFDIPNCPMFRTTGIIDTGATTCCINKKVIPEEALEPLTQIIPLIYAFDMNDNNGIEMLIGANFLRLKHQGYIRKEPLKHWKKNGELCKLDIINPDITIEDQPLKHVTLVMKDSFRKHVDSLLKIGAIRPNKSRHRTMAMIVNSGITIDPVTGREVKGKERMVFNYKSLNDNTYKDQYPLPCINMIIKRIGGAKIFSKFDLKLGFHQVVIDEESIPWTTFLVLRRLYGWLVMPFGLTNTPAVFQRKIDKCFRGTESFITILVSIDKPSILTASKRNEAISSSSSLLSGGSSTIPLCLSEEYKDHLRRNHEDFQPLPRIFTKAIFTHKEPGTLYIHYQLKANQALIRMDKSNARRTSAQEIEISASKKAVKVMRCLQAIIQYWDDDERSGRKILILQEQFSQNQQDFLDEYLPQWDDQLAIQKQKSEIKWENPFVEKHDQWLSLVDFPKHIWALHCIIACRLRMALTASFAAEISMSWTTVLHALDLFILIGA